jgi:hypothetical protein
MAKKLSEYRWSEADKTMLMKMVAIGCGWPAIGLQIGRTSAACKAMYHLLIKNRNSWDPDGPFRTPHGLNISE